MFATILRRWRLITPVALVVLAVAIVSGGVIDQVSAHGLKFHFFGWATALEDNSIIFPDHNCSTGPIDINGGSLDTGHCIPLFGGNSTSGFNNTLGVVATAQFAQATVKTDNTKFEGHTISTADVEGLEIDVPGLALVSPGTTITLPGFGTLTITSLLNALSEGGDPGCTALTPPFTLAQLVATLPGCLLDVTLEAIGALPEDADTASTAVTLLQFILTLVGVTSSTPIPTTAEILEVSQVTATAEAECEQKHGQPHASARAFSNDVFNDLVIQEGSTPVDASGDPQTHVSPSGEPNQSWPVTTFLAAGLAMQLTFNEQHKFVDGDIAWIKANAMHIIVTNAQGVVLLDLIVDHVFAGIHCAKHLPTDDSIGA